MQTHPDHPKGDHRGVDELISVVLTEDDEDVAWIAVAALHWRGSSEVFAAAQHLCESGCSVERKVGVAFR